MIEQIVNSPERKRGFYLPLLILTTCGCATTASTSSIAPNTIDLTSVSIPASSRQAPILVDDETPQPGEIPFTVVPLGDYAQVPWPCRPVKSAASIHHVEWRPPRRNGTSDTTAHKPAAANWSTAPVAASRPMSHGEQSTLNSTAESPCLPLLNEWKEAYDQQANAMESQLTELQSKHEKTNAMLMELQTSLERSTQEIQRLEQETDVYRQEVQRLEMLMEQQHTEDLAVLELLSGKLKLLIDKTSQAIQ